MLRFEEEQTVSFNNKKHQRWHIITKMHQKILRNFVNHLEFIIILANKNQGHCIMNREHFTTQCVSHRLSDASYCKRIKKEACEIYITKSMNSFLNAVSSLGWQFTLIVINAYVKVNEEWKDVSPSTIPNSHKKEVPVLLKLMLSTLGSKRYGLGKWLNKELKPSTKKLSTYAKETNDLTRHLNIFGGFKWNEYLFTTDLISVTYLW